MSFRLVYNDLMLTLNARAMRLVGEMTGDADRFRVSSSPIGSARVVDCRTGGLDAGLMLARICLADLASVSIGLGEFGPSLQVSTDHPVLACLASQYAGWQVNVGKYFAMGSGPMRAVAAREELFQQIPGQEASQVAVGVLETKKPPTEDVVTNLLGKLPGVESLSLLFAPASSLAGTIQVVARSVETALHKLHELKFDVRQVVSGFGVAPLPPVAAEELAAIGRTNDAILYGGHVTLWVNGDDATIDEIGPRVPSNASNDHGQLFAELFRKYGDFYKIDPLLFSPAVVTFVNLSTGRQVSFGETQPDLLTRSFGGAVK